MLLSVVVIAALAQPLAPPPLPTGPLAAPPLPQSRAREEADALLSRIVAIDQQLRQPAPSYVGPLTSVGLGIAGLTFSLTTFGLSRGATGIVVPFMVLGTMAGVVGLLGAVVAGIYGWGEAVRRSLMDERREKMLVQLEQALNRSSAAMPRTP